MISLDEVLAFSTKIPGHYSELELTKLYELAVALPDHGTAAEIGVLYGRSASVFFQVAQHKPLDLHLIDPWVVNEDDTFKYFTGMVDKHFRDVPFTMHNRTSDSLYAHRIAQRFHYICLLHVDGDHSPKGIEKDCNRWLYAVSDLQGLAVFHDYDTRDDSGDLMFPQIKDTVDRYCADWEKLGVFDSQAIFKRKA